MKPSEIDPARATCSEELLQVYIDGVVFGLVSMALQMAHAAGMPDHLADQFADMQARAAIREMLDDPAIVESFRRQAVETVVGADSGPVSMTVVRR